MALRLHPRQVNPPTTVARQYDVFIYTAKRFHCYFFLVDVFGNCLAQSLFAKIFFCGNEGTKLLKSSEHTSLQIWLSEEEFGLVVLCFTFQICANSI